MDLGSYTSGLLTGLREGVEAALIVSIVLAYLARTGRRDQFGRVWAGTGLAVGLSVVLGLVLFNTVGAFEEPWEQIFEGTMMLAAAAVVTWMLFWMRRQAASVKGELQAAVDRAVASGASWGLAILAFTAVIREGLETSLFLVGQATSARADAVWVLLGALTGLVVAAGIGFGIYRGSRRLNLGSFFRWTGIALIFIAAGLLSHGIHEFIEIGALGSGPWTATAYDISATLSHKEGVGAFLRAILGYSASPEILTLAVHVAYVVSVLALYLRPVQRPTQPPAAAVTARS
ncbi:MAG TPA: iron uptake transporter permease EfeU [Candidatus Limnocylindrales bacterium]|nr:iron uptake transporter permease EfeU [Candidatus Limnocylindrales bacterium]